MKMGSRVKIGIFFLVCGTLLILINNVLVKCYCEVFCVRMKLFMGVTSLLFNADSYLQEMSCVLSREDTDLKVSGTHLEKATPLLHEKFHHLGFRLVDKSLSSQYPW